MSTLKAHGNSLMWIKCLGLHRHSNRWVWLSIHMPTNLYGRHIKFDVSVSILTLLMQVFSHVEDLVVSCLDGYHVCIFAYGQTGSGKTHTMEVSTAVTSSL